LVIFVFVKQVRSTMDSLTIKSQPEVEATIKIALQHLGERLRAIYAMGSLGYGGYVPGWSDIDLDLVVDDLGESAKTLLSKGLQVRDAIHNIGYTAVDVKCYTTTILNGASTNYEYGIANRAVMMLDSAKLIYGVDVRSEVNRPEIATLCAEAVTVAHGLFGQPNSWWISRPLDDVAALLALPGRLLVTCETGQVVGKMPALKLLLQEHADSVPITTWPWLVWALAARSIPLIRDMPLSVLPSAQQAARELLEWAIPLLQSKLFAIKGEDSGKLLCTSRYCWIPIEQGQM
jgi:hypothetical protein